MTNASRLIQAHLPDGWRRSMARGVRIGCYSGGLVAIVVASHSLSFHAPFISVRDALLAPALFGVCVLLGAVIYPVLRIGFGFVLGEKSVDKPT